MESNQALTYTSPHTGRVYNVTATTESRSVWLEPGNSATHYIREYTNYDFFFEGEKVFFTSNFDENYLNGVFGEIEGIYASPWTSHLD